MFWILWRSVFDKQLCWVVFLGSNDEAIECQNRQWLNWCQVRAWGPICARVGFPHVTSQQLLTNLNRSLWDIQPCVSKHTFKGTPLTNSWSATDDLIDIRRAKRQDCRVTLSTSVNCFYFTMRGTQSAPQKREWFASEVQVLSAKRIWLSDANLVRRWYWSIRCDGPQVRSYLLDRNTGAFQTASCWNITWANLNIAMLLKIINSSIVHDNFFWNHSYINYINLLTTWMTRPIDAQYSQQPQILTIAQRCIVCFNQGGNARAFATQTGSCVGSSVLLSESESLASLYL